MKSRGKRLTKSATDTGSLVRSNKEKVSKTTNDADAFLAEAGDTADKLPFRKFWETNYIPERNGRLLCYCQVPGCQIGPMSYAPG